MHVAARPQLATLNTQPTWHNRAGRVDRSASCELTVRQARRIAQRSEVERSETREPGSIDPAWTDANNTTRTQPSFITQHTASQTPARRRITVTAHDLHTLHSARNPFVLQGDHRTRKANAMKPCKNTTDFPLSAKLNPNAGACRDKILGLPVNWSQHITLLTPTRKQHEAAQHNSNNTPTPTANHWFLECPLCNTCRRKLFLPLCTEAEVNDAALAQLWLQTHEHTIRPHMTTLNALRIALIERYSTLFTPRSLACRTCLHLRYGESKASRGL